LKEIFHFPVLKEEVLKFLITDKGKTYVDCTIGPGGHARAILSSKPDIYLIGIDLDQNCLELAEENLRDFEGRFSLYRANFKDIDLVLREEGVERVDGILIDLGISMFHFRAGRGFSFQEDAPLDMRLSQEEKLTAFKVVNEYPERELVRILKDYGEEKLAHKIARAIVRKRREHPIMTAKELAELVSEVYPPPRGPRRIHPATRTFQAIRIEVNRELENLREVLPKTAELLNKGGRLVVISFHSLEDRIVKNFFKENRDKFKILTKKPVRPSGEEVRHNPPSRSAKLRSGERI
jgi:16S rRNA (cytosine1402-N4)-methyltransferase